jgi:hypothetical protein
MRLMYFLCGVWFMRNNWRTELPGVWEFTATHSILPRWGGVVIQPRKQCRAAKEKTKNSGNC